MRLVSWQTTLPVPKWFPQNFPPVPSVASLHSYDWNLIFAVRPLVEEEARKVGVKVVEEVAPQWTLQWGGEFEIGVYLVVVFGTGIHGGFGGGGDDDIRGTWVEGSAWPV